MKRTDIEWTATHKPDGTAEPGLSSNPLQYRDADGRVVWACVKHSTGCDHCYSEAIALRFERGQPFTRANMEGLTPFLCPKELKHILTAKQIGGLPVAGSKCFLGDMTDVFGDWVSDELLDKLFAVIGLRQDVTFQILTKRADRMAAYMLRLAKSIKPLEEAARALGYTFKFRGVDGREHSTLPLPFRHLWLGTSVENQAAADARIPHLLATPAAIRFLSCEPLLGPVNLSRWLYEQTYLCHRCKMPFQESERRKTPGAIRCPFCQGDGSPEGGVPTSDIGWAIIGGESGPGARSMQIEHMRSLVAQCRAAEVPMFVKQLGAVIHATNIIDPLDQFPGGGKSHCQGPGQDTIELRLKDCKGGDVSEFPKDLQVREFPNG